MIILGINAYHGDSSACLVKDGELIAAVEEERFRRIKHWAGFPSMSIQYCLEAGGIKLSDVDHFSINRNPKANIWKKIIFTLQKRPDFLRIVNRLKNAKDWLSIEGELAKAFPDNKFTGKVHHIEHHDAHLSSAFHVSPFEKATVVSIDGFGDFASTAWASGNGVDIKIENKVFFPHSMGVFYQALTQFIGFPHYGDEYKVMGLAPYGKPTYMNEMAKIVSSQKNGSFALNLDYFIHHKENVEYEWDNGIPIVGSLYSDKMIELFGEPRKKDEPLSQKHFDIAHSIQKMYENIFFNLLNTLHKKYQNDSLCLAGGCAMNSVANGKIKRETPFKHIYIQSAAGDAGGAIGAAYVVHHKFVNKRKFVMNHAYYGPESNEYIINDLIAENKDKLQQENCNVEVINDIASLCQQTVNAIDQGKVIGWFQGRLEWGPRALGNRSILCDPRRSDMKEILNLKIKRRESFRPFAPSILREFVSDWFEEDDDVPFMMKVFQIKSDKRELIPAVTHADGSGRLQTVSRDTNEIYHQLISEFQKITGVPILLNTSFNENEPVVCTPKEALDCFLRTKMDVIVLGNTFVYRAA